MSPLSIENSIRDENECIVFPYNENDLKEFPAIFNEYQKIIKRGFETNKFPSSIHAPQGMEFFKFMGASKDLMSILKYGYTPIFKEGNIASCEVIHLKNNKSAIRNMDFVVGKVEEWVKKGFVVPRADPGTYLNPLTVSEKLQEDGSLKKRLCLDLSRTLNPKLVEMTPQLDMLQDIKLFIEQNDFFAISDIASMYCNVKLAPEAYDLFCFSIEINGKTMYFNYITIPFGLAPAGALMSQITKPVKTFLLQLHIKFFIFVDDALTMAKGAKKCAVHYHFTIWILQLCGWPINIEKSITEPRQNITYLGFHLDSGQMRITASKIKIERIVNKIEDVCVKHDNDQNISCRDMAKIIGKVVSLIPSHGKGVRILCRTAQHELGCRVTDKGWFSYMVISQQIVDEFKQLTKFLQVSSGCLIARQNLNLNIAGELFTFSEFENLSEDTVVCISDSSDKFSFVYTNDGKFVKSEEFENFESIESSGYRELLSVRDAIIKSPEFLQRHKNSTILWLTDSTSLVSYLNKGSRRPNIQNVLFQIYVELLKNNIILVPKWASRNTRAIQQADTGSKLFLKRSDEFGVAQNQFLDMQEKFKIKISVDCMATSVSRRVKRFWAPCPQLEAEEIDFFLQTFNSAETYYIAPPPKMAVRCLLKILQSKEATFVFSFPYFLTSQISSIFTKDDGWCKSYVRDVYVVPGEYTCFNGKHSLFSGHTNFHHMFLLISTRKHANSICKNPFSSNQ